jgi:glycosyltransferase involved in cell wall biosynthesis
MAKLDPKTNESNDGKESARGDSVDIVGTGQRERLDRSVLILGEFGSLNGGEHSLLAAIPSLVDSGIHLTAGVPPETEFAAALSDVGVTIEPLCLFDKNGDRLGQQDLRDLLAAMIQRVDPQLVHANSLSMSRLLGPVLQQQSGERKQSGSRKESGSQSQPIKALGHFRDILKLSKKAISDLNMLDRIIAVSNATADFHINQGIDVAKVEVVYNGVDLAKFCPSELSHASKPFLEANLESLRTELEIPVEAKVCLFVGQIGMRKGVDLLLDLMSPLCHQRDELHLVIVGSRYSMKDEAVEYEQKLLARSQSEFPPRRVHWLGRRNHIDQLMRESDVLIHPAKQEPLGRVLLEAAASGLPVITTDVGGSREILKGLEDFLFPPDDFCTASELLLRVLDDTEFQNDVSAKLRSIAESSFSAQRAGENYVRVYRGLMNEE